MKTTYLPLGLGLAAVLLAPSAFAQRATDVRVNTDPVGTSVHVMAASGSSVYVAWRDDREDPGSGDWGIYFNRSLDGGATWLAADTRLDSPFQDVSVPKIVASGSSVYVIWARGWQIRFNRSLDGGTTWLSSDVILSSGPPFAPYPSSIEVSSSSVYVIWEAFRNVVGSNPPDYVSSIYFNRSLDGGDTWEGQRDLDEASPYSDSWSYGWQMAASGSSVFATWETAYEDPWAGWIPQIDFTRSLDGGATWSGSTIVANYQKYTSYPQIAASGSSVYVAWHQEPRAVGLNAEQTGLGDIYFNRSLDAGATWLTSDVRLNTDPAGTAEHSELQVAASGSSVYVTWRDTRNGTGDIYFNRSLDGGDTWLASDVRMNRDAAGTTDHSRPQLAASGSSVYVTWQDARDSTQAGAGDIYFNIPFGSLPYGTGKAGSEGFVPQLEGSDDLHPGSTYSLTVSGGLGRAQGLFVFGFAGSKVSIPAVGATLLVNPLSMSPFALGGTQDLAGDGVFVLDIPIPLNVDFLGVNLNAQAGILDPGATFGISLSNAVEAWIH